MWLEQEAGGSRGPAKGAAPSPRARAGRRHSARRQDAAIPEGMAGLATSGMNNSVSLPRSRPFPGPGRAGQGQRGSARRGSAGGARATRRPRPRACAARRGGGGRAGLPGAAAVAAAGPGCSGGARPALGAGGGRRWGPEWARRERGKKGGSEGASEKKSRTEIPARRPR